MGENDDLYRIGSDFVGNFQEAPALEPHAPDLAEGNIYRTINPRFSQNKSCFSVNNPHSVVGYIFDYLQLCISDYL